MMHYKNTQAARKGIMSQQAINQLSREHCGAGVGTLTMVVIGALVLGVALTVLGGCAYPIQSKLADGLDVRFLPLHLCEVPAVVYATAGTPSWQVKSLKAGVDYWNEDAGMNLFSWAGVAPRKGQIIASYTGEGVQVTIIMIGFTDNHELAGFAKMKSHRRGCLQTAVIGIHRRMAKFPRQVEQMVAHEFGHMLGLDHAQHSVLMEANIPYVMEHGGISADPANIDRGSDEFFWRSRFMITASTAELNAVRGMYRREVSK